jgi:thiamine biosynthesis protein ThiI
LSKAAEPVVLVASSEFTLKSSAVRRTLEQRLIDDLKFALRRSNLDCSRVEKEAARLVVFGAKQVETAAFVCSRVFGVAYAAPAQLFSRPSLVEVTDAITELADKQLVPGSSFAIRAHRPTPGVIAKRDVELQGGSAVLKALKQRGVTVDLDSPDVTFYVDLVGNDAYVYSQKVRGPSGLPLSAQWRMLAVLDSGPLSLLASCAMMRRGCVVELLVPLSNRVERLSPTIQLALAQKIDRLVTRPNYKAFTFDIDQAFDQSDGLKDNWIGLVRAVAAKFARENRFKGIVFGDVSGHLSSLRGDVPRSIQIPFFYPLLGLDKEDLAELSRLVGTNESDISLRDLAPNGPHGDIELSLIEAQVPSIREVRL